MSSWREVPLSEVLELRLDRVSPEAIAIEELSVIAKISFAEGRIVLRPDSKTKTGMIRVCQDDLVVSGINAYKGAIALYDGQEPAAATIHYASYRIREERAVPRFLWYLLRSRFFQRRLEESVPGGIKTELKPARFLPVKVPIPSVSEQRRIVERLEVLAAKIAEARALCQHAIEQAEALLVAATSASVRAFQSTGTLSEVLSEKPRNGWSARCDNADLGTPVLTLSAVTGFQYDRSAVKRTSEPVDAEAHYWLNAGDLLITRSNTPDLVGHAAIYDGNPFPCIYPDLMMKMTVRSQVADQRFIWRWLQAATVRDFVRLHAKGTSPTMKKISQGIVMAIPFPVGIPLPEQRRIVGYLDNLQTKIDALRRHQVETAAELNALLPSVLDRAFKGQL